MKNAHRSLVSGIALLSTLAVGFSLQACGGTGPEGQSVEKSSQDLSIFGIPVPALDGHTTAGDTTATINPIGTIDSLLPDAGIKIPDPLTPVDNITGALDNGVKVGLTVPGIEIGATIGLPFEFPQLPDPWADAGGITIIGK